MKVWGFNCWGVCVALILEDQIEEYNKLHPMWNEKIVSTKPL